MLNSVAEFYEEDVQTALGAAMALIEPIMLIVMAIFVGGVLISLYLADLHPGSGRALELAAAVHVGNRRRQKVDGHVAMAEKKPIFNWRKRGTVASMVPESHARKQSARRISRAGTAANSST